MEQIEETINNTPEPKIRNITAKFLPKDKKIADSRVLESSNYESAVERKEYTQRFSKAAILACIEYINGNFSQRYNIPALEVDDNIFLENFNFIDLQNLKEGTGGLYTVGKKIDIEAQLIETPEYARFFMRVVMHELLHHCSIQILQNVFGKDYIRRQGLTFSEFYRDDKVQSLIPTKYLFGELDEGIIEKIISDEVDFGEIEKFIIKNNPDIADKARDQFSKSPPSVPAYQNNIQVVEDICRTIGIYYQHEGNVKFDTEEKVLEVFKRATLGKNESAGINFGKMIETVFGPGNLRKLGDLLQKTHERDSMGIRRDGEYRRSYFDLKKFIRNDKKEILYKSEKKKIDELRRINSEILENLAAGDSRKLVGLLKQFKRVRPIWDDNQQVWDLVFKSWKDFLFDKDEVHDLFSAEKCDIINPKKYEDICRPDHGFGLRRFINPYFLAQILNYDNESSGYYELGSKHYEATKELFRSDFFNDNNFQFESVKEAINGQNSKNFRRFQKYIFCHKKNSGLKLSVYIITTYDEDMKTPRRCSIRLRVLME